MRYFATNVVRSKQDEEEINNISLIVEWHSSQVPE